MRLRSRDGTRGAFALLIVSLAGAAVGTSARGEPRKAGGPLLPRAGDAVVTANGFRVATPAPTRGRATGGVVADFPARADGRIAIRTAQGLGFGVRRLGASQAPVRLTDGALAATDERGDVGATWFAAPNAIEELLELRAHAEIVYDLDLPRGLSLREATPSVVEIVDRAGTPRARVTADRAWDANGKPVDVRLEASGHRVRAEIGEATAFPIVVDPAWSDAGSPLKVRSDHTATLLPDGKVLLAGGVVAGSIDATAEIFDPIHGTFSASGSLRGARAQHTADAPDRAEAASSSADAGVDASGNATASTEIYDPATARSAHAAPMTTARALHAATRLFSGDVLLTGGSGDASADRFDVASGTFSTTAGTLSTARGAPSATLLLDGRVLVVGPNDADVYDPGTDTFAPAGAYPGTFTPSAQSANLLADGRVIIAGGCPCATVGGPVIYAAATYVIDPATAPRFSPLAGSVDPRHGARHGQPGTLLPSGEVLLAGDLNGFTETLRLDPGATSWSSEDALAEAHNHHTATLLASGNVLVVSAGRRLQQPGSSTRSAAAAGRARSPGSPPCRRRSRRRAVPCCSTGGCSSRAGSTTSAGGDVDATRPPSAQISTTRTGGGVPLTTAMLDTCTRRTDRHHRARRRPRPRRRRVQQRRLDRHRARVRSLDQHLQRRRRDDLDWYAARTPRRSCRAARSSSPAATRPVRSPPPSSSIRRRTPSRRRR